MHVDLSDAALPVCGESDIEAFQPYGSLGSSTSLTTAGSSCFLGEQLTLKRKKPGTLCHYNSAVSPALSATSTVCPCSRIDLLWYRSGMSVIVNLSSASLVSDPTTLKTAVPVSLT